VFEDSFPDIEGLGAPGTSSELSEAFFAQSNSPPLISGDMVPPKTIFRTKSVGAWSGVR
jgi:hypothetical protein